MKGKDPAPSSRFDFDDRFFDDFFFDLRWRPDDSELLLLLDDEEDDDEELLELDDELLLLVLGLRAFRFFLLESLFLVRFESLGWPGCDADADDVAVFFAPPPAAAGGLGDRAHTLTATPISKRHRDRHS